jgi:hypothetical protein
MQRSVFWRTALMATLAGAVCSTAFAGGTMFRCGSSYQDRPCEGGQPSKVVGSGGSRQQQEATPATAVDGECAERGNRAKQIVWAKESGKTAEVQMAAAASDDERRLIADVYRKRGSSLDVQNAVQADCMAQKERAAQAAALMEAAGKLTAKDKPPTAPVPSGPALDPVRHEAAPQVAAAPNPAVAQKKARCQSLKEQQDSIASSQRAGGDMTQMEQLNRQRQSAAKAWRDAGC